MEDRDLRRLLANATGVAAGAALVSLDELRLRRGAIEPAGEPPFCLEQLKGRLVEVSAVGASHRSRAARTRRATPSRADEPDRR